MSRNVVPHGTIASRRSRGIAAGTGPIRTVLRLLTAFLCLFMHLFRTDLLLMVDRRWVYADFHYRSVLGLYTGFRVQCEYEAQAPAAPAARPPTFGSSASTPLPEVAKAEPAQEEWLTSSLPKGVGADFPAQMYQAKLAAKGHSRLSLSRMDDTGASPKPPVQCHLDR